MTIKQSTIAFAICASSVFFARSAPAADPTAFGYNGGDLLAHPRVFVDYWCFTPDDPANARGVVTGLIGHIGNSKYLGTTEIYAPGGSDIATADFQPVATWDDPVCWPPDNPPRNRHPSGADLGAEVQRAVTHFGATGDNDIIVIFTSYNRPYYPPGACGYHSSVTVPPTTKARVYVDQPYPQDTQIPARWSAAGAPCSSGIGGSGVPSDITSVVLYHEIAESITDPRGGGWWDLYTGAEIGDIDERTQWRWYLLDATSSLYPLQPLWDITAHGYASAAIYAHKWIQNFSIPSPSNPVISTYWNDGDVVAGRWVTAGSLYHVGSAQPGWVTRPAAAHETTKTIDTFANVAGQIVMQQDGAPGTSLNLGNPVGWSFSYSPAATTYGWSREDVFGTALLGGSCGPPYSSCSSVWHISKPQGAAWHTSWDQLPSVAAGVFSGVGAIADQQWSVNVGVIDGNNHLVTNNSLSNVEPLFGAWSDEGNPGATLLGDPTLTSNNPGQFSAWVVDSAGNLWEWQNNPYPSGTWVNHTHPRSLGLYPSVAAVSNGDESVFIEGVGFDGQTYRGGFQNGQAFAWASPAISSTATFAAAACH